MNYEEMSDLQINSAVLCEVDEKVSMMEYNEETDEFFYCDADGEGGGFFKAPDYCNNPSDAWPIIFENKIDIAHTVGGGVSCAIFKPNDRGLYQEFYSTTDKKPFRAAMICFLKMKDAENGNN